MLLNFHMSKRAERQHVSKFAAAVRDELAGVRPDTAEEILQSAVRCAALAILARPEVHDKLMRRLRSLLQTSLDRARLKRLIRFVSFSRSLVYEEGQEAYLTVSEAARRLGVARSTVYRWIGNSDMQFSPVHDDPDLGPDRIPVASFRSLVKTIAEKGEMDDLKKVLTADLPAYEVRIRHEIKERLREHSGPLTVKDLQRAAEIKGIRVSDATIRRWPAESASRSRRGRPPKSYSIETAADRLAKMARKQRARVIRSSTTLLQTLRRLRSEIPGTGAGMSRS